MNSSIDIWKVLAGVAIFLLGIKFLEESLHQLAGRKFKLFLKKQTSNKFKAIGGGAIVTAVLQSSSLVNLMVLAFTGAGIITMYNALAIILGANLGSTFTGWVITIVGFKMNVEAIALPVAGIAGLGFATFNKQTKWYNWSRFFLGFGFLFIGLGYMRTGIENSLKTVDLSQFQHYPVIVFLFIGFIITALIQSSSATMAITLSALFAGAVNLYDSTAIILGSEIGTTIKLFIASMKGLAVKRRVALGNFLFNTITVLLVLIFLRPVNSFITHTIGIKDNLIALVFFQSLVNVIGIILFFPLLNLFGSYLERLFKSADDETMFIHKANTSEPSSALDALENENRYFLFAMLDFAMHCFAIKNKWKKDMRLDEKFSEQTLPEKYEHIKSLHGEIHGFCTGLRNSVEHRDDIEKLDRLISSVRNIMYAAKNFKDAMHDTDQLRNSANDIKFKFYTQTRSSVNEFFEKVMIVLHPPGTVQPNELILLYRSITDGYTTALKQLYHESTAGHVSETEITTLLNFNREIFTAFKSLFFGLKDYLLDKEQSKYFEDLPGFIR